MSLLAKEGIDVNDPNSEWIGMPEYHNKDMSAYRQIIVSFDDEESITEFSKLVDQTITDKTKYIWYPKKEKEEFKHLGYKDES